MGLLDRIRARRERRTRETRDALASGAPLDDASRVLPGTVAQLFDADRPRRIGKDDPLRRDRWVRVLEHQLKNIPVTDSFVFSLEGPWGTGKTSVLDTIESDLTADGLMVLRFNPWLFAGANDLVGAFFRELAAQLRQKRSRFEQLGNVFGALASLLGAIGLAAASPVLATLQGIAKGSGEAVEKVAALESVPSLLEAKRNFEKTLARSGLRLVVLVDDLERLCAREALEVLRAVRVLADLPGLIYVLAFDRDQLVRALEREGEDGLFLDKIIQISMRLPSPPSDALRRLLFQKLDAVLAQLDHADLDKMRWSEAAREIVLPLAKTPRDIARLANAVAVALAHVGKRVALEDVIALETLRVFEPRFFGALSSNRTFLTAGDNTQVELVRSMTRHDRTRASRSSQPPVQSELPPVRESILALARERKVCEDALKHLFPPLGEIDGQGNGSYERRRSRRSRRVCVTEVFDLYFEAEPRDEVLDLAFVAAFVDADAARVAELVESTSQSQLEYLFNTLGDHAEVLVRRPDLVAMVVTLLRHVRRLPARDPEFFVERPEVSPARFLYRVLEHFDGASSRRDFLGQLFAATAPDLAATVADVTVTIEKNLRELDLQPDEMSTLLDTLRVTIRGLDAGALSSERALAWLLPWAFDRKNETHKAELKRLLADERLFAAFVGSALRRSRYSTGHLEIEYRAEPYEGLFDEAELRSRLRRLVESDGLATADRDAVRTALDSEKLIGRLSKPPESKEADGESSDDEPDSEDE